MAVIVKDLLNRNHYATGLCTQTFFITFIAVVVTIGLPFVLLIMSRNYWLNTATYLEAPDVRHLNEIMLYVYTTERTYMVGSTKELNQFSDATSESGEDISPSFEILNHDHDQDGKTDLIDVRIIMHMNPSKLRNIALVQSFVSTLDNSRGIFTDIKTRTFSQFTTPYGFSKMRVQGQLNLIQRENFALGVVRRQIGIEPENELAYLLRTKDALDIYMEEQLKNVTTSYDVLNTYVQEVTSSTSSDDTAPIQIDLLIDIPKNWKIRYTPNSMELTVKFLMQYIALLIPSVYIFYEIVLGWGFRRNLLRSKITSEIKDAPSFDKKPAKGRQFH